MLQNGDFILINFQVYTFSRLKFVRNAEKYVIKFIKLHGYTFSRSKNRYSNVIFIFYDFINDITGIFSLAKFLIPVNHHYYLIKLKFPIY